MNGVRGAALTRWAQTAATSKDPDREVEALRRLRVLVDREIIEATQRQEMEHRRRTARERAARAQQAVHDAGSEFFG